MIIAIKWTAYYLMYIPAIWLGYFGYSIIPDRKDVIKMPLTVAIPTVIVFGGLLLVLAWVLGLMISEGNIQVFIIISIVENIWLGFLITALPGAVFFEVLRRYFHDRNTVLKFLYGNFAGVITIAILALVGMPLATDFIQHDLFYVVSGLVLIYIGLSSVVPAKHKALAKPYRNQAFFTGLVLSLANPISVVFWVTMVGSFYVSSQSVFMPIISSLSIVVGAILFFVLFISLLSKFGNFLKPRHTRVLASVFGCVVAIYGLFYIIRAISFH